MNHVLYMMSRSQHGKGQFWVGNRHTIEGTLRSHLCKHGWTDRFCVSVVDSSGPKDAQVQSYSTDGANVPSWEDTLPSPAE